MIDCSPMALYNRAHFLGAIPLDQHQRTMKSANSRTCRACAQTRAAVMQ